ncbi:SRPBCC family protein [Cryptosporangium phraense]|uniref:SRPBCC family protein n=1 Tax=Cryptosporangium phraense TaxID=2593070 RepID=A0A545ALL3_9ACTN|nr:SRPBCC family protein [Cryptosporangium phraense]TQS42209.1 SRPBCC family protein [Cryptosporangium phraense]
MQTVRLSIPAPPDRVFAVLTDGWAYASWVVGASHIRNVDDGFPAVGTRIHHSVGGWPAMVEDTSEVLEVEPDRLLVLKVKVWPLFGGIVRVELEPDGEGTMAVMSEEFVDGPGKFVPEPLIAPLLNARNRESLRRLADRAVNDDRYAAGGAEHR